MTPKKHGYSRKGKPHKLYVVWQQMKQRCYNPNCCGYKYWGGRGITICQEWAENAEIFIKWCFANGYKEEGPRLTIDRKNNNLGYSPENCKIASYSEQISNRRLIKKRKIALPKGVCYFKGKFKAATASNYKRIYLGTFDTPEAASQAYQKARAGIEKSYLTSAQ